MARYCTILGSLAMSEINNPYASFVKKFLSRGAVGLAIGYSAVSIGNAAVGHEKEGVTQPFAERLATLRSAVSEQTKDVAANTFRVAQNFSNFINRSPC